MTFYLVKIAVTAALVVLVSEVARRSSLFGALLASLPIVSLLAMLWLYVETGDAEKIRTFSVSVFWLAIPSLAFFLVLPLLLKQGFGFYPALALALVATLLCYGLLIAALSHFGIRL